MRFKIPIIKSFIVAGLAFVTFLLLNGIINAREGDLFSSKNFKMPKMLHYDYFDEVTDQMEGGSIEIDKFDFVIETTQYNVEKIVDNGRDDNRLVMVIMGDGYTKDQLGNFHEDATSMVNTFLATSPWDAYNHYINVYVIDVISNESGADHPLEDNYVDTAIDASFGTVDGKSRLLRVNEAKAFEIASSVTTFDVVIVIVNDKKPGGSSGTLITISSYKKSGVGVLHEIGHFLAKLADEYGGNYDGLPKDDEETNVTFQTDLEYIPWRVWVEPDIPLPTPEDQYEGVGLYEGAKYHDTGTYRPRQTCMMRTIGHPYCEICKEALVLNLYNYVDPIDYYKPSVATVFFTPTESLSFSIDLIDPLSDTLSINWELDGEVLEGESYATFSLDGSSLREWTHTLKVSAIDQTSMVRNDPYKALSSSRSWTLVKATATGDVSGMVKDTSTDVPIEGAIISLSGGAYITFSQEDGSFNLFEIKEGTYTLTTSTDGYLKSYQNNIEVVDGDITLVDVYLEPEQICPATVVLDGDAYFLDLIRKFRDEVLRKTPEGKELIRLYYEWSPAIIRAMEGDEEFKEDVKEMIDGIFVLIGGVE